MSYTKTDWTNGQTPINATNLNKIENQLEANDIATTTNTANITTNTTDITHLKTYSTTETVIGTWTNNKPLYKKTYNSYTEDASGSEVLYLFENGTNFAKNIDIKNREFSVKLEYLSSGNYLKAYNGANGVLGNFYFGANISGGNVYIGRGSYNSNYIVREIEATIYYTKNTD